jgi:hypothetical protein
MATNAQVTVRHTDHALLVGLGLFGHQIGLFEALDAVRFPGRVYKRARNVSCGNCWRPWPPGINSYKTLTWRPIPSEPMPSS